MNNVRYFCNNIKQKKMEDPDLNDLDIEEAKIIISLKNDEIKNVKSALKAIDIKNNLRQADFQYKIDQMKGKVKTLEGKAAKTEESHKKVKTQLEQDVKKMKESNQALNLQLHQKERELNGIIYEERLKLERQRQSNHKLNLELETIHKYFEPKKVLSVLQKQKLEEIPTYLNLYEKYIATKESLDHLQLQTQTLRSQIMSEIQSEFLKMKTYQNIMEELRLKNQLLKKDVEDKEMELQIHTEQIDNKKDLIERIREENDEHLQFLNSEIIKLKKELDEKKEEAPKEEEGELIQEYERKLIVKQEQIQHLIAEYDEKIALIEEQNRQLKEQMMNLTPLTAEQAQQLQQHLQNLQTQLHNKTKMLQLSELSLQDQEDINLRLTQQLQTRSDEINDLIKRKKKTEEESRINEEHYQQQIQKLNQELQNCKEEQTNNGGSYLIVEQTTKGRKMSYYQQSNISNEDQPVRKLSRVISGGAESFKNRSASKNLLLDLNSQNNDEDPVRSNADFGQFQEEQQWQERYYSLLDKHNEFARKVCERLKKLTN